MFGQLISHPKEETKKKKEIEEIAKKKQRMKKQRMKKQRLNDRLFLDQQNQLIPRREKEKLKND